jgi:hypothetical protein
MTLKVPTQSALVNSTRRSSAADAVTRILTPREHSRTRGDARPRSSSIVSTAPTPAIRRQPRGRRHRAARRGESRRQEREMDEPALERMARSVRRHLSKVPSDRTIYLEEFDRRASNLDESDYHSRAWAVRGNDDFVPAQGVFQVVYLEGHMRDGLHEIGIRRILPVPLPLDAERIALMITHRDSQVGRSISPSKRVVVGIPM